MLRFEPAPGVEGWTVVAGPHDLRHTFSTWLEDAGIPTRVIDELMGRERGRHAQVDGGSRVGARYRHTTPEMASRVMTAIDERLTVVLQVAEAIAQTDPSTRVFQPRPFEAVAKGFPERLADNLLTASLMRRVRRTVCPGGRDRDRTCDFCRVKAQSSGFAAQVNGCKPLLTSIFVVPCCPSLSPRVRRVAAPARPTQALSGPVGLGSVPDSLSNLCSVIWPGGDLARPRLGPADRGAARAVRGAARRRPGHRPQAGRQRRALPPRRRHQHLEPHAA
jgi:hypothetical protein